MTTKRHPPGIRPHGSGWETYCRVNGEWHSEYWPADTPIDRMQRWLAHQKKTRVPRAGGKTIRSMMPAHLDALAAMPSVKDRTRDCNRWVDEFGDRSPYGVERADVQRVLARWETEGVAASTIRHRRTALAVFYDTELPDADNPARAAKAPRSPRRAPRGIPIELMLAIIDEMPDTGRGAKGEHRPAGSQARVRCRVMAWTGIPPKQMMALKPADLHLDACTVDVSARRKGAGHKPTTLPLIPEAVEAFREWVRLNCWGKYSTSSVRQSFKRACKRLQAALLEQGQVVHLEGLRPYDCRHTWATYALMKSNGNAPGVQRLMLHSTLAQTMHYAEAGVDPLAQSVIDALKLAGKVGQAKKDAPVAQFG